MKKIVSDKELILKMKESIDLLCNTVKTTLGPSGNNIIIDNSLLEPYITNDGVTIAKNIESEDEVVNTILELAKEATINTDDNVGDGTTTTLVLLQSIFNEGLKCIESGISPIILKKELDKILTEIINKVKEKSRKPSNKELKNIALISSNDEEIGNTIYEVFSKIKDINFINLVEGTNNYVNYTKGYVIDTLLASPYFLESNDIHYNNPYILISDTIIYDIESISQILNYVKNKSLVIISSDYDDNFVNQILSLVKNNEYKILLLKTPEYGNRQMNILKDIECISLGKINYECFNIDNLGMIKRIIVTKEKTVLDFLPNKEVKDRILDLKQYIKKENSEYEKDFYNKRLAMLKNKTAEIVVGGINKTEIKEKMMRYTDALNSISTAYNGVLVGSGLTIYEISNNLEDDIYHDIFKNSLKTPLIQIITNAGLNKKIIDEIVKSKYTKVYNITKKTFEDISNTNVLDSTDVVLNSIINATTVAGLLLSTTSLIINENKKNNINNYDNL